MEQLNIFNSKTFYKITKPIRLIELFAGYGSQAFALKYLGVPFEHYKTCEWAIKSIQAYKDAHFTNDNIDYSKDLTKEQLIEFLYKKGISSNYNEPMTEQQIKRLGEEKLRNIYNNIKATHNMVNIQQVHSEDLEIKDIDKFEYLVTYSYPCGLAGTKIITVNGYKNIEDITTSDYVLTHNNRFCKVNKIMSRTSNHYYFLKGLGVPKLYLTGEHPLYVYRNGKFQWVKVKNLTLCDKLTFNVNQNSIDAKYSKEYLWMLGRYVANGYINKYTYNSVNFSINFNKEQEFLQNIPSSFVERFKKFKKAVWDYRVADKELKEICLQFKTGAKNKEIPQWIIDLPKGKLQSFFNGYMSGDGHIRERGGTTQLMFTTVSENLFLGLQQIIAKLYGKVCSCYIRKDTRKETYNNCYGGQVSLTNHSSGQKVIDDKIVTNIRKIEYANERVPVYNFEVDKDNSYTCNNVIVHNCQDLSLAGKQAGMQKGSGTRSGMLWEVERILSEIHNNGGDYHKFY